MSSYLGRHAVVIGGSIAGLLAARVLAEQFDQVTVIDRDRLPLAAEPRRGMPQSVQPMSSLPRATVFWQSYFQGLEHHFRQVEPSPLTGVKISITSSEETGHQL